MYSVFSRLTQINRAVKHCPFFCVCVCVYGRVCMVVGGGQMYAFSLYTGTYILIKKGEVDKCLKEKQTNKEEEEKQSPKKS